MCLSLALYSGEAVGDVIVVSLTSPAQLPGLETELVLSSSSAIICAFWSTGACCFPLSLNQEPAILAVAFPISWNERKPTIPRISPQVSEYLLFLESFVHLLITPINRARVDQSAYQRHACGPHRDQPSCYGRCTCASSMPPTYFRVMWALYPPVSSFFTVPNCAALSEAHVVPRLLMLPDRLE